MDLNIQEIKQVLTLIKVENYHLVLDNKRPLISKNAVNKSILEKLKKKKMVSSFPEDTNNEECYRVYPYQKIWDKLKQ